MLSCLPPQAGNTPRQGKYFWAEPQLFTRFRIQSSEQKTREVCFLAGFPARGPESTRPVPPAWDEVVNLHQHYVYNLAYHLCNNRDEADDLTQETFLRAFEHLPEFRGEAGLRTWLGRIAINAFLATKRRPARHVSLALETIPAPDWSADPERVVIRRELQWCIHHVLQHHLREDHKLVLILRDLHQFGYGDIARMLGISLTAVKSRLHRARKAYRDHLVKSGCAEFVRDYTCWCEGVREV